MVERGGREGGGGERREGVVEKGGRGEGGREEEGWVDGRQGTCTIQHVTDQFL